MLGAPWAQAPWGGSGQAGEPGGPLSKSGELQRIDVAVLLRASL